MVIGALQREPNSDVSGAAGRLRPGPVGVSRPGHGVQRHAAVVLFLIFQKRFQATNLEAGIKG
jgi:hypothetical protein